MGKWTSKWGTALLAIGLVAVATVAGAVPGSVRKQVESSLLVTGEVDIEPNGSVSKIAIDHEEKLPEGVRTFVREAGLHWRFEPVLRDGKPIQARAPMSVRVVAKKVEGDQYRITLSGASFERRDDDSPERVGMVKMDPPAYPERAWRTNAAGSVYLVVKVGRDGKVQDVVAEQVNLRVLASEGEMRLLRNVFAKSALAAAKAWQFRIPTQGDTVDAPFWNVRVPVSYAMGGQPMEGRADDYGKWISYVPGPRTLVPWAQDDRAGFSPDALIDGGVYMADSNAPRLLTPLQGS